MIFIEDYYKLIAQLLVKFYNKHKDWKIVVKYYEDNFKKAFIELHPKIVERGLF